MITDAESVGAVQAAVGVFRPTWSTKWSAVVVSLDEAGDGSTAYLASPVEQWRVWRTENAIERIFGEFRRRTKTQGVFATPEAITTVVWGTLASGGILLRKMHGYQTIEHTLRQAA